MPGLVLPDHLDGALVVAVDDSDCAREALRFALTLAKGLGQPLAVVHVWNFVTGRPPEDQGDEPPSEAAWQAKAEAVLTAILEELPTEGVQLRPVVLHGNTTPVLLAISRRAAHLMTGSRGRGGFAGLVLGSTTDQLVHHASCPVTVVRRRPAGAPAA